QILDKNINEHIESNELKVLGRPLPTEGADPEGDWDNPDNFTFEYDLAFSPEVVILLGLKALDFHIIEVEDKMIDDQIQDMTRRYGSMETPEASADKDLIMAHLIQLDDKDEILAGGIINDATIGLEFVEDKKTKKALTGLKTGENIVVDPAKLAKDQEDLGRILGISEEEVAGLTGKFKLTVNDIKRLNPAEINDELFSKAFPSEEIASEDDFRAKIKSDLEGMFQSDAENLFKRSFAKKLIEDADLTLPDEFLKRWIKTANEEPISDEQIENDYPNYAENLKWQLIQNKVIEDEKLEVTPDELKDHTAKYIQRNYQQYGMTLDGEQLDSMVQSTIANAEERRRLFETLYEHKVVDALKEKVKIKEKPVKYDKFLELARAL
ncbi:MAG: hypothetical protein HRT74_13700, partial [Flavobacteriales bacterium]|nr:hypothetical protein [Flavobacteriales bacterium]